MLHFLCQAIFRTPSYGGQGTFHGIKKYHPVFVTWVLKVRRWRGGVLEKMLDFLRQAVFCTPSYGRQLTFYGIKKYLPVFETQFVKVRPYVQIWITGTLDRRKIVPVIDVIEFDVISHISNNMDRRNSRPQENSSCYRRH